MVQIIFWISFENFSSSEKENTVYARKVLRCSDNTFFVTIWEHQVFSTHSGTLSRKFCHDINILSILYFRPFFPHTMCHEGAA